MRWEAEGSLDFKPISSDFVQNTPNRPHKVQCVTSFKVEKE